LFSGRRPLARRRDENKKIADAEGGCRGFLLVKHLLNGSPKVILPPLQRGLLSI